MAEPISGTAMTIAALANIAGGLIGGSQASAEAEKAQALLDAAIKRIDGLQIPDLTKDIIYQMFSAVGDFTPQYLDNLIDKFAPVALIKEPPENKLRQLNTYNQIKQVSLTGLGPQDKLAIETAKRKAAQDTQAQTATIESQFKQRGQFGSGQQFASLLSSAQSSADRQAMENLQTAAGAGQNRLAALKSMGDLENYLRSADLNVEEKNVLAKNQQEEFKNKYMIQRTGDIWQNKNLLAQDRRQQEQLAANKNIEQANKEAYRKGYEAPTKMFEFQMDKEKAMANLMGGKADAHMGLGSAKAKSWSDIGSGVGMAAIAAGGKGGFLGKPS
jgi:hypothetical protein